MEIHPLNMQAQILKGIKLNLIIEPVCQNTTN